MRAISRYPELVALWIWVLIAAAGAVSKPFKIQGTIFISPSGQLEGDLVMRATETEVLLLRTDQGFERELEKARDSRSPTIEKQLNVVNKAQDEFLRATRVSREGTEKRSVVLRRERAKLADLKEAYEKEVNEIIAKHAVAKTKTDSDGKFRFEEIAEGRYLIHAHFEIVGMAIHYYWLLPVDLKTEKETEVSLTKKNSIDLF